MPAQSFDQVHHIAANQGLAPRQANAGYAARNEAFGDDRDLVQAQQLGAGQEGHLLRHAIAAAQVAPVGHGNTQIADCPPMTIDQRPVARAPIRLINGIRSIGRDIGTSHRHDGSPKAGREQDRLPLVIPVVVDRVRS